jgi:hypothetical protein
LSQHGGALTFQLVLVRGGVAVGADRHWGCTREKCDGVVVGTRRWHTLRLSEDGGEHVEEGWKEVVAGACPKRRTGGPSLAAPAHPVIAAPEGHRKRAEVPQDGSQRRQPLHAQDHIVAGKSQGEEVPRKCLTADGERHAAVRARAWYLVTVCHSNL